MWTSISPWGVVATRDSPFSHQGQRQCAFRVAAKWVKAGERDTIRARSVLCWSVVREGDVLESSIRQQLRQDRARRHRGFLERDDVERAPEENVDLSAHGAQPVVRVSGNDPQRKMPRPGPSAGCFTAPSQPRATDEPPRRAGASSRACGNVRSSAETRPAASHAVRRREPTPVPVDRTVRDGRSHSAHRDERARKGQNVGAVDGGIRRNPELTAVDENGSSRRGVDMKKASSFNFEVSLCSAAGR